LSPPAAEETGAMGREIESLKCTYVQGGSFFKNYIFFDLKKTLSPTTTLAF
jgi:hypothetical protein